MKKDVLIWQALFVIFIAVVSISLYSYKHMLAYKFYTDCLLNSEAVKLDMSLTCLDITKK